MLTFVHVSHNNDILPYLSIATLCLAQALAGTHLPSLAQPRHGFALDARALTHVHRSICMTIWTRLSSSSDMDSLRGRAEGMF